MNDPKIKFNGAQPGALPHITIWEFHGAYVVNMPKDQRVIDLWKTRIGSAFRKFQPNLNNGWLFDPCVIEIVCQTLEEVYGGKIKRPDPIGRTQPEIETRIFPVEYVGSCHQRPLNPQGRSETYWSAYGAIAPKQWMIEFPEDTLKKFFGATVEIGKQSHQTLYQVLLVPETSDFQAIKSAYRRLARQWHPDVCAEPDAHERFIHIQDAYDTLCDPIRRNKYDAGLYFERQGPSDPIEFPQVWGYRSPLTSGLITVKGIQTVVMTRFLVHEILTWEDLRNNKDQVAISSWRAGQETYQIIWR